VLLAVPQVGLDGMEVMPALGPPTDLGQPSKLLTTRGYIVSAAAPHLLFIRTAKAPRGSSQALWKHTVCVAAPVSF